MSRDSVSLRTILVWSFVCGLVFNAAGWAGNQFLLGDAWDAVNAAVVPEFAPPWPKLAKELMTFVSDFVYAFALVYVFAKARVRTIGTALATAVIVWLAGAVVTYLALVNSGFLPWEIAVKTSLLALGIFLVTAPLLPATVK